MVLEPRGLKVLLVLAVPMAQGEVLADQAILVNLEPKVAGGANAAVTVWVA